MRIARFCMDSICSVCVWVYSIVPNRCAVLEDRPYNCDVEMQELVGGNTRSLELF